LKEDVRVRQLPLRDPGVPDIRSPGRFLLWTARGQLSTMLGATAFGAVWMVAQALMPALVGDTINQVIAVGGRHHEVAGLVVGCAGILGLGIVQHVAGTFRHRFSESSARTASSRTIQVVTRHVAEVGSSLTAHAHAGDVVSVGAADMAPIGDFMRMAGRMFGAVASFVVVAVLLLRTSIPLGAMVLVGVPLMTFAMGPLLRPLHKRQRSQRDSLNELSTLAVDLVHGLRVLRGIGAEPTFSHRYRERSQHTRAAGVRLARVESLIDTAQILLPGLFNVLTLWFAARLAFAGVISPGALVTLTGFAGFLIIPLQTATEFLDRTAKGLVAARRVVRILAIEHDPRRHGIPVPPPVDDAAEVVDTVTGLAVERGRLTVVSPSNVEAGAALADRLGGYSDGSVQLRGIAVADLLLTDLRRTVLVVDTRSALFDGPLRDELDPWQRHSDDEVLAALSAVSATDIVDTLPNGWRSAVGVRGQNLSGGQRQRLVLARALLADADVLILVEPTSAVDAHTESRIARGVADHRRGRTTVVISSSPVFLAHADNAFRLVHDVVVPAKANPSLVVGGTQAVSEAQR
jgi:ABC-type multidrug transport system fused ATPase/permease subunit